MTEPTPEPTPDEPVDPGTPADDEPGPDTTVPDTADGADDTGRGNPEAAKWRKQYRASEVKNTVLQARVDEMMRREVQRVAAEHLADPNDIWREPVDVDALYDDLGLIDPVKVREHVDGLIANHPHWARRRPATPSASAVTSDASPYDKATQANWSEVLRGGA